MKEPKEYNIVIQVKGDSVQLNTPKEIQPISLLMTLNDASHTILKAIKKNAESLQKSVVPISKEVAAQMNANNIKNVLKAKG